MIDIVGLAKPVHQVEDIADGGNNILGDEMLRLRIHGAVAQHQTASATVRHPDPGKTKFIYLPGDLIIDRRSCGEKNLSGMLIDQISEQLRPRQAAAHGKFLVDLVAAHLGKIVPPVLEK